MVSILEPDAAGPAMTPAPAQNPAAEQRPWFGDPVYVVIALVGLNALLPLLLKTLTAPKYRASVGDDVTGSAIATLAQRLTANMLLVACIVIILSRFSRWPRAGRITLFVMLAPWVIMLVHDNYLASSHKTPVFLYGVVVIAIWALQPPLNRLVAVGWITAITLLISMALGFLMPAKGLFTRQTGQLIAPQKEILNLGILVGLFSGGNALALFLVCGMACFACYSNKAVVLVLMFLTLFCLVWTAARAEIAAALVVIVLLVVLAAFRPVVGPPITLVVLALALAGVFYAPLSHPSDQAYTNRGYIWRISFQYWRDMKVFGGGTTWYSKISDYVNPFPSTAFNGHNVFVHTLVIGGLVTLVPLIWLFVILIVRSIQWAARGNGVPAAFMAGLFVCSITEVSFGFADRGPMLATVVVPMAFVAFSPMPALQSGEPVRRESEVQRQTRTLLTSSIPVRSVPGAMSTAAPVRASEGTAPAR